MDATAALSTAEGVYGRGSTRPSGTTWPAASARHQGPRLSPHGRMSAPPVVRQSTDRNAGASACCGSRKPANADPLQNRSAGGTLRHRFAASRDLPDGHENRRLRQQDIDDAFAGQLVAIQSCSLWRSRAWSRAPLLLELHPLTTCYPRLSHRS